MGLEEITKNKEIPGRLKEENFEDNLESKINSGYNLIEGNFSKAGESTTIAAKLYNGFVNAPAGILNAGYNTLKNSYKFIVSEDYRSEKVKDYIRGRIYKAEQKGRISTARADYLYGHLDKEEISPYMLDLFMHTIGLNAIGSLTTGPYFVYMPFFSGEVGFWGSALRAGILGSITRTAWTIGRISYDCLEKKDVKNSMPFKERIKSAFKKRSVAFGMGNIPFFGGILGYPAQMIHSEYKTDRELGDFLLDDSLYGIEKEMPIIKRIRKWVINKIYKDSLPTYSYGTNKNNRNKGVG